MSSIPISSRAVPSDSRSPHSTRPLDAPRHSRLGRWANALAAVSLVLLLGVGYWFSGYGPGGSGGEDPIRYAAQVVTPAASPAVQQTACVVEPLTTDEVVERIGDPDTWAAEHTGERMSFTPGALTDPSQLIRVSDIGLDIPDQTEFEAMEQVTNQYLDCLREGTVAQLWAMYAPHMLQREIFGQFPIYRSEEDVRSYIDESLDMAAADFAFPPYVWEDVVIEAVPDREQARVDSASAPIFFAYVPSQGVNSDGTIIATSDWQDNIEERVDTNGPPPTLGAITLVQYPGSDEWFINDTWVMVPKSSPSPVASPDVASTDIVIAAEDIEYDPAEITIPANTDVRITLVNNGFLVHDFVIDELGIQTDFLSSGESAEITINAAPGEYTYYCSAPGHQDAGQEGKLIVE